MGPSGKEIKFNYSDVQLKNLFTVGDMRDTWVQSLKLEKTSGGVGNDIPLQYSS